MRLLMDSVFTISPGIIQLYNELVQSIEECAPEDCDIVLLASPDSCTITNSGKLHVVTVDKPSGGWLGRWKWYHKTLPLRAKNYEADVIYSFTGILSKKLFKSFGLVNTVNNMVPFTPESLRLYYLISRKRLRGVLLRSIYINSLKMADSIVLHSRHASETIKPYTGDISSKIFIALTGIPRDLGFNRLAPPSHPYNGASYFLYFSTIYPYKNHLRLIEAYRRALKSKRQLPDLILAGLPKDKTYLKKILSSIRVSGLEKKIKYIGFLDRKDVPAWLYYADVNFFPSTCETNSLVLAEILGLGGVLACSNIPPMPEIAEYAAEFFDPYLLDSIENVIVDLSCNSERRNELRRLALKRTEEFSWRVCGKEIWKAVIKAKVAFLNREKT